MSNRRKTYARRALQRALAQPRVQYPPTRNLSGELIRTGGDQNWPYGARRGASKRLSTIHEEVARHGANAR